MGNDTVIFNLEIREEDKKHLLKHFNESGKLNNPKQDFFIKKEGSSFSLQVKKYLESVPLDKAFILSLKDGNIICTVNPDEHKHGVVNTENIIKTYFKNKPIENDDFIGLNILLAEKVHHLDSKKLTAILSAFDNKQEINARLVSKVKSQEQEIEQLKTEKNKLVADNNKLAKESEELKKNLREISCKNEDLRTERLKNDKLIESLKEQIKSLEGKSHQETKETKSTSHLETISVENTTANSGSMPETSSSDQNSANESSSSSSEEKGNLGKKIAIGLASSLSVLSLVTSITLGVLAFTTTVLAFLAPVLVIGLIAGFFVLSGISLFTGLALAHSNTSTPQNSDGNVIDTSNSLSPEEKHSLLHVKPSTSNVSSFERSKSTGDLPRASSCSPLFFHGLNKSQENDSTSVVSPSLSFLSK